MHIEVMSRTRATEYAQQAHKEKIAVVSISDTDKTHPPLMGYADNGIFQLCQVHFDDVEINQPNCITEEHAHKIASFVFAVRDSTEKIVVHCEAGISRSAEVAGTIMKFLNGNDWAVFDSPKFRPNMTCYRSVLNALYKIGENILPTPE